MVFAHTHREGIVKQTPNLAFERDAPKAARPSTLR